jgi:diaminopimelate epimerase
MAALRFTKAHSAGNDFIIIDDPGDEVTVTPEMTQRICDRHHGIGADGIIRAVHVRNAEGCDPETEQPLWFMDHINSDGTVANMCGNGLVAYTAYLESKNRVSMSLSVAASVMTRAGLRSVRRTEHGLVADLGAWNVVTPESLERLGGDVWVSIAGISGRLRGIRIDVGVPHTVVRAPNRETLFGVDFTKAPIVTPAPVDGSNVELVFVDETRDDHGSLSVRVHERGIGETQACGTGAVACSVAARIWDADGKINSWDISMPGGNLHVDLPAASAVAGSSCQYVGVPVIVAEGVLFNA